MGSPTPGGKVKAVRPGAPGLDPAKLLARKVARVREARTKRAGRRFSPPPAVAPRIHYVNTLAVGQRKAVLQMPEYLDRVRRARAYLDSAAKQIKLAEDQLEAATEAAAGVPQTEDDESPQDALADLSSVVDEAVDKINEALADAASFESDFENGE